MVTVVDAFDVLETLEESPEAVHQIAFADVIILNKTDLVDEAKLASVETKIRQINPFVRLHKAVRGNVPLTDVLDQGGFDLQRALEYEPDFLENTEHSHEEGVTSMSFPVSEPLDEARFHAWISALLQEQGADILRSKGILNFAGHNDRYAFQAVHMMADGDFIGPWKEGEKKESRLVLIGRNLNRPRLRRGFESCRA